jgi:hypothetical protein
MWNPAKNKETLFIVISSFNFDGYLKIYFSFSGQRTVNIYEIQSDIFRITKYILWNKNRQEDQAFRIAMPICNTQRRQIKREEGDGRGDLEPNPCSDSEKVRFSIIRTLSTPPNIACI